MNPTLESEIVATTRRDRFLTLVRSQAASIRAPRSGSAPRRLDTLSTALRRACGLVERRLEFGSQVVAVQDQAAHGVLAGRRRGRVFRRPELLGDERRPEADGIGVERRPCVPDQPVERMLRGAAEGVQGLGETRQGGGVARGLCRAPGRSACRRRPRVPWRSATSRRAPVRRPPWRRSAWTPVAAHGLARSASRRSIRSRSASVTMLPILGKWRTIPAAVLICERGRLAASVSWFRFFERVRIGGSAFGSPPCSFYSTFLVVA
jgi:hypothetical protein